MNNVGLADKITEEDVNLSYTRNLNPNLLFIISVGIVGIRDGLLCMAVQWVRAAIRALRCLVDHAED